MWNLKSTRLAFKLSAVLIAATATFSCTEQDTLSLTVSVRNRSLSKMPYIIAWDQGLFEKHGLNVELWLALPEFEGGRDVESEIGWWNWLKRRLAREVVFDITTRGATPMMLSAIRDAPAPHDIVIGSTDCTVRSHIIGRKGLEIENLEDLKGMRLRFTSRNSTIGFQVLLQRVS